MPVVARDRADRIAREWLDAWNAHDPGAVVAHFAEDVTAASPLIEVLRPGSGGHLRGREEVLAYYEHGLHLSPDLRFELCDVLCGVDQVTILYRSNKREGLVAESLILDAAHGTVTAVQVSHGNAPVEVLGPNGA